MRHAGHAKNPLSGGQAVTPTQVTVGTSTTASSVQTTPVTLTLPDSVWAGRTVTVSHRPGASPTTAFSPITR